MNRLSKEDLSQMNQNYFQSLDKEKLVEVAGNLHSLAVEQLEKLEQNSSNSSLPPSSDQFKSKEKVPSLELEPTGSETSISESKREDKHVSQESEKPKNKGFGKKLSGKQAGAKGIWRTSPLVASQTVAHHPLSCASCNSRLEIDPQAKPYMGYYVLELEKLDSELIVELQSAEIIHLDETPWYEKGKSRWLWVAITSTIAVFHIGSRRKEELLHLISEAFVGWLIADGYGAYSSYPKRQHCLAHLIRKAIALTEAVDKEVADLGQWLVS
ncbi:IS66 family transposase [Nostoc sp. KVJ3]|uniref:IS66 family transposase n=1 Tax=Nostoc sp. KVJ3 TaxID=457945 RepID=UPI0022377F6B|nr:transposase [Nostoc sp. KVJ3]